MGIPKNRWMVYFMENPIYKWMIWGYPYFRTPPKVLKNTWMKLQPFRSWDEKQSIPPSGSPRRNFGQDRSCVSFHATQKGQTCKQWLVPHRESDRRDKQNSICRCWQSQRFPHQSQESLEMWQLICPLWTSVMPRLWEEESWGEQSVSVTFSQFDPTRDLEWLFTGIQTSFRGA